jgi:hypothetical protein
MVSELIFFAKYVFLIYKLEVLGENCPKNISEMTKFSGFPPSSNSVFDLMSNRAHQIKHMLDLMSNRAHQIKHMFDLMSNGAHQIKHMLDLMSNSGSPNQTYA